MIDFFRAVNVVFYFNIFFDIAERISSSRFGMVDNSYSRLFCSLPRLSASAYGILVNETIPYAEIN